MSKLTVSVILLLASLIISCVTINVYFPEAAAVEAADRIIDKVRGDDVGDSTSQVLPVGVGDDRSQFAVLFRNAGGFFISDAQAQTNVDFDRASPEKQALEAALANRFKQLKPYLDSGAVGLTDSGLVDFHDRSKVPLKDRSAVVQLIAEQNNDWNALYREIARINGHPEWEDSIRQTFAERWVAKADRGWYYREDGVWKQK